MLFLLSNTSKMVAIKKAIELKKELDTLRPINTEQEQRIMQKFRLDWNYHSNHLEGNSLTYGETKALLLFGVTAQGKPLKDTLEITGHNEAINWVIDLVKKDYPLTENFIRELHSLLLKDSYKESINEEGKIVLLFFISSNSHFNTLWTTVPKAVFSFFANGTRRMLS